MKKKAKKIDNVNRKSRVREIFLVCFSAVTRCRFITA